MTNDSLQHLEVVRIVRRSEQGVTRPFLCEVADGRLFWAKGHYAGRRALCCEWIAGSLAQAVGLPIPPFAQLLVSEEMIRHSLFDSAEDLGHGLVFGSHDVEDAQEFGVEDARRVMRQAPDTALLVLMFDWWIQNEDRTLGDKGGNPNLLVSMADQSMKIIDHNIAFDDSWSPSAFFANHVFAASRTASDRPKLLAAREKLRGVRGHLDKLWDEVPDSWRFVDHEAESPMESPMGLTRERVSCILDRAQSEWEGTWL
jgi:hypothetical protein